MFLVSIDAELHKLPLLKISSLYVASSSRNLDFKILPIFIQNLKKSRKRGFSLKRE